MLHLFAMSTVMADGVTIKIGDHVWSFGLNIIIYLLVAAIVGLVAEAIVGWRLPFGFVGAIIAALVGIWLLTNVVQLNISGDPIFYGVPIIKDLLCAIILVAL